MTPWSGIALKLYQSAGTKADTSVAFCFLPYAGSECVLLVTTGDCEYVSTQVDKEIIEDGKGIFELITLLTAEGGIV